MRRIFAFGALALLLPAVALASFNTDLRRGESGGLVLELQQFLAEQGHLAEENTTSYFGPLTFSAVQAFQSAHNVRPVSGFFGPLTRAAANGVLGGNTGGSNSSGSSDYMARVADLLSQIEQLQTILAKLRQNQTQNPTQGQCQYYPPPQCGVGYTTQFSGSMPNGCRLPDTCVFTGGVSGRTLVVSPTSGSVPLPVTFSGTASGMYTLDFGDSTPNIQLGCSGCGVTNIQLGHTYTNAGTYTARLTDEGGTRTFSITVTAASPSLSVSIPTVIDYIDRGYGMNISWQGQNAPAGSKVYISLIRGNLDLIGNGGVIASALNPTGAYSWTIPQLWQAASEGQANTADVFLDAPDIVSGQSYRIRVGLYTPYEASGVTCPGGCSPLQGTKIKIVETASFIIAAPGSNADEQRWKDLQTIETALEAYKSANGSYPGYSTTYFWIDDNNYTEQTPCSSTSAGLKPYLSNVCTLVDPAGKHYAYRPVGSSYKLGAQFETTAFRGAAFTRGPSDTVVSGYYEAAH